MMKWIRCADELPVKPGAATKEPLLVAIQEFGHPLQYAVANCWISTDTPLFPKWYLDEKFYGLDRPWEIALTVTHWCRIEAPGE